MRYHYAFFDADDTLLDFNKSADVSFSKSLEAQGIIVDTPDIFKTFQSVCRHLWKMYERGELPKKTIKTERFRQTFLTHKIDLCPQETSEHYLSHLCENVFLIDHAVETCRAIKDQGKILGIITNGIGPIQFERFKRTPLKDLIDFMVVSEEDLKPKPHSEMFERAMQLADHPDKSDCVMIGDNLVSDILGANKMGISSCWYNPENKESPPDISPTYTVNHLQSILEL